MVNNTNSITSQALLNANTSQSSSVLSPDQSQFMTLLVAQMRNQDPLNPMDNNQMTSQMAMLNMANGINNLNKTLNGMSSSQQLGDSLKATDLIGHSVQFKSNSIKLQNGNANFAIDLAGNAQNVNASILDKNGTLVRLLSLGQLSSGTHTISWDGISESGALQSDGQYTISIDAQQNGQSVDASTLQTDTVSNLILTGGLATLQLSNMGSLSLSDIRAVY